MSDPATGHHGSNVAMVFVLTVVLIIALIGSIPKWPHSKGWGYYPTLGLGLVLLVLLILVLMHRFNPVSTVWRPGLASIDWLLEGERLLHPAVGR
jgi:hypothetical protein